MKGDLLNMFQTYQQYTPYAVAGLLLFCYNFLLSDISRIIQYTAYKLGYRRGSGKGVIPGPLEDTSVMRYIYEIYPGVEYRKKYGSIYRTFSGGIPEIVISDPDDVRIYYQGDFRDHDRIENLGFGDYMKDIISRGVGGLAGDDWRRIRAMLDPHFTTGATHEMLPGIMSFLDQWAGRLPTYPVTQRDEKNNRFVVKAEQFAFEIPFELITRRLFGDLVDDEFAAELAEMVKLHERIMVHVFMSKVHLWKIYKYLPIKANRERDAFIKKWNELLLRKCLECEKRGITNVVYEMYQNMKQGDLTWDEFSHTIDEVELGNTEIMPAGISWTICELGMRPDIQERLVVEIKAASQDKSLGATREERREAYVKKTNTLLHFCYLEATRLRPLFCYSFSGTTRDSKVMSGYYIPPKSAIVIDGYTLNRTAPVWGDDPNVFRPDRFATLSPTDYRYSLWRFGIGPRKCLAAHFAEPIIKLAVAGVIERYHVELKDHELTHNPQMFVYSPKGVLIFTPREGKI